MRLRNASMFAVGALLTVAAAASAQDTTKNRPRSQRRIPVTKEAPGEVMAPRIDTVTVYRTDTLRVYRTDTLRLTNTVTRYDTVRMEAPMAPLAEMRKVGGFYFGLAAGASAPAANFNDANKTGWRVEVPFGIDPISSPLGLRFNLGYSNWTPHSWLANRVDNAQMMNADADLKLRVGSLSAWSRRFELYGVGGGTYNRFKDVVEVNRLTGQITLGDHTVATNANTFTSADHDWRSKLGYNVGGGAQVGWGRANLYAEARYNRFNGENSTVAHVPLMIGLTWY